MLTDLDVTSLVQHHDAEGALATIALKAVDNPLEFGIVITREDGSIDRFLEKPTWGQVFSDTINTGIYVLEPEIFDFIAEGRAVDFSEEVFPAVLEARSPCSGTWRVATGRTSEPSRPTSGHTRTSSTRTSPSRSAASPCAPAYGSAREPSSTRRPRSRGPAIIGDNCHVGASGALG